MAASRTATRERRTAGRVHLYVGISLDGYIAGPDHDLAWLDPYQDARAGFAPFMRTIGSAVMGRGTYDVAVERGFASFGMPSYVVTHRPLAERDDVHAWSGDLKRLVATMRKKYPRDIWLLGGGKVTAAFADANLIDIWSVAFIPTVLGAGIPMFPERAAKERRLRLTKTKKYPSGVIELRYERALSS